MDHPVSTASLTENDWAQWRDELGTVYGLRIDDRALDLYKRYAFALSAANREMNLISPASERDMLYRHLFDSLAAVPVLRDRGLLNTPGAVIDYGTGGGLPGIPLGIASPDTRVMLVESINKKCVFLGETVTLLQLKNVAIINERMEILGRDPERRGVHDAVVTRAAARLTAALECGLPLVRTGGIMAVFSRPGPVPPDAQAAAELLGARSADTASYAVPRGPSTQILVFEKIRPTPEKFPRRTGMPDKRPL